MSIEPGMKKIIEKKLDQIEKDFNVKIILAIESGSRAWGFESVDSDYDVRFIYRHELKWYLNVLPKRDVIELPIIGVDDYSGWDIRKTLFLMNKSNPVLFEWMRSPIVYKRNDNEFELLKKAAERYFSPVSSIYHYLHMAKGNYREYLQGEYVKVKKYFYVLRPILACLWIKTKKESPPVEFEKLLENVEDQKLLSEIAELLRKKKSGTEMGEGKAIPEINQFIDEKLTEFETFTASYNANEKPHSGYLDDLLWKILN